MKWFKKFKINTIPVFVLLLLLLFFSSCSKSSVKVNNNVAKNDALVGIVHASAGSPALDIGTDQRPRLGLNYFTYTDRLEYYPATPGNREFKIFYMGSASTTPMLSKKINLEANKYYTFFIVDTASKMDLAVVRDSTRAAGTDSVRIRFANMSPDTGGLDLYVQGNTTPVATNITYKTAGNFGSMLAGANKIFEVKATGSSTLLATSDPMNLTRGNVYTIWTGGYVTGDVARGTRIRVEAFAH